MTGLFTCPHCKGQLIKEEKRLYCEKGHSFDMARQGYVNLLVGKGGGVHGDDKEMIRARRDFLNTGHYAPLREELSALIGREAPRTVLDAGCGEGYYTEGILSALPKSTVAGVDISKDALAYAAVRLKGRAQTAVASVYDLPAADGSFEALTLFFSPYCKDEYRRVLKKEGLFIMAIPGRRHLFEMKELLYEHPYENEVADFSLEGFELFYEKEIAYPMTVEGQALKDLFAMTPYYYRTPKAGRERAAHCDYLQIGAQFHLLGYRRNG